MSRDLSRGTVKWEPVCHWDQETPVIDSPYRTPVEGATAVGYKVCHPGCWKRPDGAVCYDARTLAIA